MRSYNCSNPNHATFKQIQKLSALLKIVGDTSRLQLLCILSQGTHCVCELIQNATLSQSLISHHLHDLKAAGLVTSSRQGQKIFYSLTASGQQITASLFSLTTKEYA